MRAHGHVFKYGDNVDTDVIIPARYLNSFDAQELASHAMADIDPDFVKKVQSGDIIVANKKFRMRIIQRTCAALLENGRSKLHYRGNVRKNLLQKCNQYRSSDY